MASHYEAGKIRIPARIYPGMFRGEVQVTIEVNGQEINLIVSDDFIELAEEEMSPDGVDGDLIVDIVTKTNDGYLVNLPGEVQGATNRVEYAQT